MSRTRKDVLPEMTSPTDVVFLKALAVSFLAHAALAAALVFLFQRATIPTLPSLDLAAVEISFFEETREENDEMTERRNDEILEEKQEPEPEVEQDPEVEPEVVPDVEREPEVVPEVVPEAEPEPEVEREPEVEPEVEVDPEPEPPEDEKTVEENDGMTKRRNDEMMEEAKTVNQARIEAPPRPLKAIRPDYPKGSRQRGEEGSAVLTLSISARGTVEAAMVETSSGFPELDAAAVRAALKARFAPARSGDKAVPSTARITISFRLK